MTELIYHFVVLLISLLVFFMKFTAPGAIADVTVKIIGKLCPLYCMLYSGIQIFKHFNII